MSEINQFLVEETPLFVDEAIFWGIYSNLLGVAFFLSLASIAAYVFRKWHKEEKSTEYCYGYTDDVIIAKWGGIFIVCFLILLSFIPLANVIKAKYYPRLYLVEQLTKP